MKRIFYLLLGLVSSFAASAQLPGMTTVQRYTEHTKFYDKKTGEPLDAKRLLKAKYDNPNQYVFEPLYDAYGADSAYLVREATLLERETGFISDTDTTRRPKIGQPLPPFVMQGVDGRTYRSADLKGNIVVLTFWIMVRSAAHNAALMQGYDKALRPFASRADLVALGVVNLDSAAVRTYLDAHPTALTLVPSAFSFSRKYQIIQYPSCLVIDKAGNVAAYLTGDVGPQLTATLKRLLP